MENLKDKIRQECWDKCIDSCGFSYIYSKKIESIEKWQKASKIMGIIIPVFLGGILASYSSSPQILEYAVKITTPLAIAQLLLSTYLMVTGADDTTIKASAKTVEYSLLHSEFRQLANYPDKSETEYKRKFDILLERENGIGKENFKVSDKELRMGMRYGLREYRRSCAGCNEVPSSMISTSCSVCGNF